VNVVPELVRERVEVVRDLQPDRLLLRLVDAERVLLELADALIGSSSRLFERSRTISLGRSCFSRASSSDSARDAGDGTSAPDVSARFARFGIDSGSSSRLALSVLCRRRHRG
jgi:hypothetical protein